MNTSTPINISPEHCHQVVAFLIAIILFSALFALDKYLSEESRQFRHIRRLVEKAKAAVQQEYVSAETRDLLQFAQQDFYRASKLMVAKPALPATLRQTMEFCQQQCHYIFSQVSEDRARAENATPENAKPGSALPVKRQCRKNIRKTVPKKRSGHIYW
ncbi:MAG: hypothetical protein WC714_18540 [Candidatus Obscuribacterales bacterium]|jgi:hypothetical protein